MLIHWPPDLTRSTSSIKINFQILDFYTYWAYWPILICSDFWKHFATATWLCTICFHLLTIYLPSPKQWLIHQKRKINDGQTKRQVNQQPPYRYTIYTSLLSLSTYYTENPKDRVRISEYKSVLTYIAIFQIGTWVLAYLIGTRKKCFRRNRSLVVCTFFQYLFCSLCILYQPVIEGHRVGDDSHFWKLWNLPKCRYLK